MAMAARSKNKAKSMSKAVRSLAKKSGDARKPSVSKKKAKATSSRNGTTRPKPSPISARRQPPKVELRDTSKSRQVQPKVVPAPKPQSREYTNAVSAYEAGLKLMHAEEYAKAIKAFSELIAEHTEEP